MVFNKNLLIAAILLSPWLLCYTQDYQWWNDKHNWDGFTPWHDYIITSPAYMGPNALRMPTIKNGAIQKQPDFKFAYEQHFSSGDITENLYAELYLPLFTPRVGLNVELVPIEHYKMEPETRDERRARNFNGDGYACGDFYLATYIQVFENKKYLPDALITINLKTASGTKLSDARYTDTPGYYIDLSLGKSFNINKQSLNAIRLYTMAGLYVWQLHGNGYFQNDAFLYGLGFDIHGPKLKIKNAVGGYYGYIGNGDRPMVYRFTLSSNFNSSLNYEFRFQQGLHDFEYSSFRFGCNVNLEKLTTLLSSI